ncbi:Dirigent protein - like 10 [Theobroma cacao]|nr:Dirigent protein - like 10 [Theobroma cacao]
MLTKQNSIFFLVLFAIISFSTIAIVHQSDEFFSRYISPLSIGCKRQKLSHLYFYFHDTVFDKNAIVIRKYRGSTFSVLGRNKVVSTMREMSIVGGSRVFRLAHGYVEARTHTFDLKTCNVVVECNVYVSIIELQVLHFQDNI